MENHKKYYSPVVWHILKGLGSVIEPLGMNHIPITLLHLPMQSLYEQYSNNTTSYNIKPLGMNHHNRIFQC